MTAGASVEVLGGGKLWLESRAVDQLAQTATLPGVLRAVGMPDLHPGQGSPVGAALLTEGIVYPHLVGSDVGCGMALWDTGVALRKVDIDRLERRLDLERTQEPSGHEQLEAEGAQPTGHEAALGTVGGGNHFAELLAIESVVDAEAAELLGLDRRRACLLVHSGSRGLGAALYGDHLERWGRAGLEASSDAGQAYLDAHDNAVRWARANRAVVAERFLAALRGKGRRLIDITHNGVERLEGAEAGWLHRKGAAPAGVGPVVIPGSRGDLSYVVAPRGDGRRNLASLAHGAGRKWARSEAKGKLGAEANARALRRTRLGSRVICDDKELLFEEAPQAYKPIATVIEVLVEAELIAVIAELRPLLTYKMRSRSR